jgi:precorrin-6B methylase 1
VPYDAVVAYSGATKVATLTDDKLADYGDKHAKYDAVILATGDLGHSVSQRRTARRASCLR